MISCFVPSYIYHSSILSFYLRFLVVPYSVLTIISEPLCLNHHHKSLFKHVSDLIDGAVSSLVLYILCCYSKRADNYFYFGFIVAIIIFCITSSYGPFKNFTITNSFSKGLTQQMMALGFFWIILVIYSLSTIIETIKQLEYIEIASLWLSLVLTSSFWYVVLDTDWSCYRLHIHHWILFYVLSLLFRPHIFSNFWSDFILGFFFGSFIHGIIMFGPDSIIEIDPEKIQY